MTEVNPYEYCMIQAQVRDDGRDPGRGGHKIMWLQFIAEGHDGRGRIVLDRSESIPLANMTGAQAYTPRKNDVGHQNVLANFLTRLQADRWEIEAEIEGEWWQRRLRRARLDKAPSRPRFSHN